MIYAIGIGLPFLALSLVWGHLAVLIKHIDHALKNINVIGGVFLMLLGILMVTGYIKMLR